jgi:hypothetical protein
MCDLYIVHIRGRWKQGAQNKSVYSYISLFECDFLLQPIHFSLLFLLVGDL